MINFPELNDERVIVTGGSKGVGKEIALSFAKSGARVIVTGRNKKRLTSVVKELNQFNKECSYICADMTDVEQIYQMIDEGVKRLGGLDVLVNNAGVNIAKDAVDITEEDWDLILDTNLKGSFFCSQRAGIHMIAQKEGKIINISSQMAFVGYIKRAAYSSSKGGILQLTKSLAIEWAPYNIKVNSVAPTFIKTEFTADMFTDENFYKEIINRIPLGRLAKPSDVAGAVLYLASDLANIITGETIKVDGGWTAI